MSGTVGKFKVTLKADGLRAAMRWLNDRVPYRFTAIFAFDGDMLRNICLIDKDNQKITNCSDQPLTESYCMYVHRSGERFGVEEASLDKRVAAHPKRHNVQCYYGIPLFGSDGQMLGTVCHFDSMPVRVTEEVASALDDLAPLIAEAAFSASVERLNIRGDQGAKESLEQMPPPYAKKSA
jgi:GAF domain-containing protein